MRYAVVFIFFAGAFAHDFCPTENLFNFYRELGCTPVKSSSPCPTSFNCPKVETRNKDQCYYNGKAYSLGQKIPSNETAPHCRMECKCNKEGTQTAFTCAYIECPDIFTPFNNNCRQIYSRDSCCAIRELCLEKENVDATCHYNGNNYHEGERFYPENTCLECHCMKGFRGELVEPFCRPVHCGVELSAGAKLRNKCAPVFYAKHGCCPTRYICPSPRAKIIPGIGNKKATVLEKCRFGDMELNQFDIVEEGGDKCECLNPPYVTCISAQ